MTMRALMLLSILLCSAPTLAYEIGTHAYVSKRAVDGSVLSPTHAKSIVPVMGFERLDAIKPFEARVPPLPNPVRGYFDNAPRPAISIASEDASNIFVRRIQAEEGNIFERLANVGLVPGKDDPTQFDQRLVAWVMRGAVREDDNAVGPFEIGDRDQDPWNVVFRAGRHFYDPINRRGLDEQTFTCPTFGCRPAIDWAAGRTDVLNGPGSLDTSRENHFSWQDARDQYWWALTFNLNPDDPSIHGFNQRIESGYRQLRFATTLKAIGQVIHLVQDMAQPQHARNDSHGPPWTTVFTGDSPTDGAYEAYTEARLFREAVPSQFTNAIRRFDGSLLPRADLPMLRLAGNVPYPVPRFSQVVEYFTTQGTDAAVGARRGMADLANRGFFTASTLPMNIAANKPDDRVNTFLDPPRPSGSAAFYQEGQIAMSLFQNGAVVLKQNLLFAQMPDVLAPNWNAQSGLFGADGRMPILTRSQMFRAADLIATPTPITQDSRFVLSNEVFTAQADAMLPRAVAYSTGLIDYFFRGRLEVTPTAQKAFALLNQGEPHTMDLEGYPRRPDGRIFGFEKVRLAVRNVSEAIVESGPAAPALPQTSPSGVLVAVARYHRNTCYQPDLSGERQSAFAPPSSTGVVTEPDCPPGTTPRTDFQEIATSAPLTVASVADLPGGEGTAGPALPVEKVFDFSADPIPVNATDLFIQVVYRGALGEEPDGIAVGSYDLREPAFVGIWNNTDFYWDADPGSLQWVPQGGLFPWQNAVFLDVCTGAPSRFAWSGGPVAGAPILGIPVPEPGVVRLALLFAIPATPTQQFSIRVTPNMIDAISAPQRSWFTRGAIHQANLETIPAALLDTPQTCPDNPTAGAAIWCKSPIQRRRGQPFGHVLAPVFYDSTNGNTNGQDVDATPVTTFPGLRVAETGTVRYNNDVLADCPLPPLPPQNPEAAALIELLETAADLGIPID